MSRVERGEPLAVAAGIPASNGAVEFVGRGPKADVRHSGPVRGVVPGAPAGLGVVGDFVMLESSGRQPFVREEILLLITAFITFDGYPTADPVSKWRVLFDG